MADDAKQLAMLRSLLEAEKQQSKPLSHEEAAEQASRLMDFYESITRSHDFTPGSFAKWKSGLRNKKKPRYDEPIIIMEMLEEPILAPGEDAGSAYFREPLDMIAGFIDSDDDFVIFHFDSRRFEPYT